MLEAPHLKAVGAITWIDAKYLWVIIQLKGRGTTHRRRPTIPAVADSVQCARFVDAVARGATPPNSNLSAERTARPDCRPSGPDRGP